MSAPSPNVPPQPVPPPYTHPHAGYASPFQPVYVQPPARSSGCAKVFAGMLLAFAGCAVVGICLLFGLFFCLRIGADAVNTIHREIANQDAALTEKFVSGNAEAEPKIAVITIEGMITSEEYGFVAKQIRKVQDDTHVKAVVLRVISPGGTMAGSDYYLHLLNKMKKKRHIPIVVSMGSMAASGGYFVSMCGDEIYAEPSTITGSIGVIVSLFNGAELLKKIGIESTPITSGPMKAMGSFAKPLSDEEKAVWQTLVNDSFDRFKKVIRDGRGKFAKEPAVLDKLATGQIYTATEAAENGLVDKIGFVDEAVDRAIELANLQPRDCKVVRYKPHSAFMESLFEGRSADNFVSGKVVSEITTPQIYLLCPQVVPVKE